MRIGRKLALTLTSSLALAAAGGTVAVATAGAAATRHAKKPTQAAVVAGPINISKHCRKGIYSGYCGTEQNLANGLGFSYKGSSDWFALQYQGGSDDFFEYAPKGKPDYQCITESGSKLLLSKCTGNNSQLFLSTQVTGGFTIQNVATGNYVQDNGKSKPLTLEAANGQANQVWNFTITNS